MTRDEAMHVLRVAFYAGTWRTLQTKLYNTYGKREKRVVDAILADMEEFLGGEWTVVPICREWASAWNDWDEGDDLVLLKQWGCLKFPIKRVYRKRRPRCEST